VNFDLQDGGKVVINIKAQINRNKAKQVQETLQEIQDSLTKIEAQIADIVIELHNGEGE